MDSARYLAEALQKQREQHLYRQTAVLSSPQEKYVEKDGRRLLLLCSNSYLDLCHHPALIQAAKAAAENHGVGSGGSRLTTGTYPIIEALEQALADYKGTESALVFSTGYMANVGVLSALCDSSWMIFSDALNHASIIDGCRLSRAKVVVYRHNDMEDLEQKLQTHRPQKGLIVTDGVFSMDGDLCLLPKIQALAKQYDVMTMVDEAHATGVVGATGRGTGEWYGLPHTADITVGTMSKALGGEGGFVCGSTYLIDYLKNKARSFIFSTAMSPVTAAVALAAVELLQNDSSRTKRLQENVAFFCKTLQEQGLKAESQSAIVPLIVGEEQVALTMAKSLEAKGYLTPAIRYPTVAKGQARLRMTLMSSHTKTELEQAATAVATAYKEWQEHDKGSRV